MPLTVLDRFLRPLLRRPLSSGYPRQPLVLAPSTRGLPELDTSRCEVTATCVTACPTNAIVVTTDTWRLDAGRCVFCAACVEACPVDAIRMGTRVELADRSRDGLLVIEGIRRAP